MPRTLTLALTEDRAARGLTPMGARPELYTEITTHISGRMDGPPLG